jgi:hypothetical protein
MASYSTVKNVSTTPLIVDRVGHSIGAGEFGPADVDAQPAKRLVEEGLLVVVELAEQEADELDPGYEAALEATTARNDGDVAPAPTTTSDDVELDDAATTSEA